MRAADHELRRLETLVETLAARSQHEAATTWAGVGAHFATLNHPGRFTSPRLECVLGDIGREVVPVPPPRPRRTPPERVLHVLTEAYETGGHTRLVRRWIERDSGRSHSIVLTNPASAVPDWLREAAGGELRALEPAHPVARARELRALADEADLVVLHVHMQDTVPLLALADRPHGPPVVYEDHADHLFWLGASIADTVVSLRRPALELARSARGVAAERSKLLPIPVHPVRRTMERAEAKAALGVPADTAVLLTVAMPYKYAPVVEPSFLDVAVPAVAGRSDCVLVAVGPDAAGDWRDAAMLTGGRVRADGIQRDLAPYYHAADAYLDSYPFSSNTSLIEAAGHGVPVVSFSPDAERQGVLLSNDPGIEELIVRAATPAAYRERIGELLDDGPAAAALGDRLRQGIEASHSGTAWFEQLESVYATAAASAPAALAPPARAEREPEDWEAISTLLFERAGQAPSLEEVVGRYAATLGPQAGIQLPDPAPPTGWDVVAVATPGEPAIRATLDAVAGVQADHHAGRLALALPPDRVEDAVPAIERWLDDHPEVELNLVPTQDPAQLLAFGRVLVAAAGDPLVVQARARGIAHVAV
jgi:hypothetical protein